MSTILDFPPGSYPTGYYVGVATTNFSSEQCAVSPFRSFTPDAQSGFGLIAMFHDDANNCVTNDAITPELDAEVNAQLGKDEEKCVDGEPVCMVGGDSEWNKLVLGNDAESSWTEDSTNAFSEVIVPDDTLN